MEISNNIKVYKLFSHIRAECKLCGAYATSSIMAKDGIIAIEEAIDLLYNNPDYLNKHLLYCSMHMPITNNKKLHLNNVFYNLYVNVKIMRYYIFILWLMFFTLSIFFIYNIYFLMTV